VYFSEIHHGRKPVISFELYPPKTDEAEAKLFERVVPELLELEPAFLTCTYGAGGSTREKTLDVVARIKREFGREVAAHLTCVGSSRQQLREYLLTAQQAGICNVVALRGDVPQGDTTFRPHADGFRYARELVTFIRELGGFEMAVAGYPEGHPEAESKQADWDHCCEKVEAGGSLVMTQLFFDNQAFFEFEAYLRGKGVRAPIVPGVLPILNTGQIKRFCGMCGSKLPARVLDRLESYADDPKSCQQYGIELATQMCSELLAHGCPGIHFYTLNRSDSISAVLRNLGLAKSKPA
jgi:methylenetetrahydrofolate reductase (NADPH)